MDFAELFKLATGFEPMKWQIELAGDTRARSRLIRIPTGFGKTLGVLGAWVYNRIVRQDDAWPRRIVLCLPMRVLVEQTEAVVRQTLDRAGLLRNEGLPDGVTVHLLMGGASATKWHLDIDGNAVLIGTQDMLLSRALNRGYASGRARWPVEFGLLTQDALWVFDEVQLMDVGLATSAQLGAFLAHAEAENKCLRPLVMWWMSATMQRSWLESVDTKTLVQELPQTSIGKTERIGRLWDDIEKPVSLVPIQVSNKRDLGKSMAEQVNKLWQSVASGLCLVVVNTVDRACEIYDALEAGFRKHQQKPDLRLVHSRFRPAERISWHSEFLNRWADVPSNGRIVVATQVVEAGVDLDANLLITELAPWPSLVQRFGRAARGGGIAQVIILDPMFDEDRDAAPYAARELAGARDALSTLTDVSPLRLESFEDTLPTDRLAQLYPYNPPHLLLRHEVDELFDITPDLTGADLDISRFIRSGDERDVSMAWVDTPKGQAPLADFQPAREALCAVPFLKARAWLCDKDRLREKKRAWVWDFIDGAWQGLRASKVLPGEIILVASECGGYDPVRGFDPSSTKPVVPIVAQVASQLDHADLAQDTENLSETAYKTIGTHSAEVAAEAVRIAQKLALPERYVAALRMASLWHDLGKTHPAFQGSIRSENRPNRNDLAKAPDGAWSRERLYQDATTGEKRPGFRHELASTLGLFAVLQSCQPDHPALLGPWKEILGLADVIPVRLPSSQEQELLALSPDDFDLVAYLVASHHGKVRTRFHAAPADQNYVDKDGRGQPIRGVREGDVVDGLTLTLEPASIGLSKKTGRSWTDRVAKLLRDEGPFVLALLEACFRAADVYASRLTTPDPLLKQVNL